MKRNSLYLLFTGCILLPFYCGAQSQFSGWLASFNTIKTAKKISIHTDVQLRSSDRFEHAQTLLLRPGLNFHINKKNTVTAGYALVHGRKTAGSVSGYLEEHRIWEQYLLTHKWKRAVMSHRFRAEQRFLPVATVVYNALQKTGTVYSTRLRYFHRTVIPFSAGNSFIKGFFTALQNEVFVNLTHKKNVNGETVDQNRFYFAAGYRLSSKTDIEAGYLNQYVNGKGNQSTNNHIIQVATYLRL